MSLLPSTGTRNAILKRYVMKLFEQNDENNVTFFLHPLADTSLKDGKWEVRREKIFISSVNVVY